MIFIDELKFKEVKIRTVILIYIITILIMCLTIFGIMSKSGTNISDTTLSILDLLMESIIAAMLIFTFKPTVYSVKLLASDVIKKVNKKEIISIVIFKALVAIGGQKIVIDLLYLLDENFINSFMYDMIIKINEPVQYITYGLLCGILCPIIDELIFRNIIFKSISKKFSAYTGVIISSILFAAINVGNGIAGAFIFGVVNCIMYIKYENIFMPMLINFSYGIVVYISLIPFFAKKLTGFLFSQANIAINLPVACLMFLAGLILFFKFWTKNKNYISVYDKELKNSSEAYAMK